MQDLATTGDQRAVTVLRLMSEPLRFIGTLQLGISGLGILVGTIGEPFLRKAFSPPLPTGVAFVLAVAAMTFLSVLAGDLVPKAIALQRAERLALRAAAAIVLLERLAFPLVWLLQLSAASVLRILRLPPAGGSVLVRSEQDLRGILGEAEESGVIAEAEEELLYSVFEFAAAEARTVMVPRANITALKVDLTVDQALIEVLDAPYNCHPVFERDLDHVVGVLHLRDLFTSVHRGTPPDAPIAHLLRPAFSAPETEDLGALLAEFRRTRQLLAVVVNAAGETTGIVTREDVLETVVGEIADAYGLPDESVRWTSDRTVRVAGTFPVDDFDTSFGVALPHKRAPADAVPDRSVAGAGRTRVPLGRRQTR